MARTKTESIPATNRFIKYEDLLDRLCLLQERIYSCVSTEETKPDAIFAESLRQDTALKQTTAEILLASVLWIEADRNPLEILQYAEHEIRKSLVYIVNSLIRFLELKQHTQPTVWLNRCSVADAWIHLFVEFYSALGNPDMAWIWELQELPFVNELQNCSESPWVSWKMK